MTVDMYPNLNTTEANIEIEGYPFFAEEITANEAFNRRELKRTKIMNGTEFVTRSEYISREFSFTTDIDIDMDHPDSFYEVFRELCSKPCEVVSPEMGGIFKAQITIKPQRKTPDTLTLTVSVKEIPDVESLVLGEDIEVPEDILELPDEEEEGVVGE